MPWKPSDAKAKTHLANTPAKQKQWAAVANRVLAETGDDARAIRAANATIHHRSQASAGRRMLGGMKK